MNPQIPPRDDIDDDQEEDKSPEILPVASVVDGRFRPNLEGNDMFFEKTMFGQKGIYYYPNGNKNEKPTETLIMEPVFDYKNKAVIFEFYDTTLVRDSYYVDPDSDFLGMGFNNNPSYTKEIVKVGEVINKIESKDMPVEFDDTEVFLLSKKRDRASVYPALFAKDSEGNPTMVAYWDHVMMKWDARQHVKKLAIPLYEIPDTETEKQPESYLTPDQLKMIKFQKLIVKSQDEILPNADLPVPHLPGDTRSIFEIEKGVKQHLNTLEDISARQRTATSGTEALTTIAVLEAKLNLAQEVIGSEDIVKIADLLDLYTKHKDLRDFPTGLSELYLHWKKLLNSIDTTTGLTAEQKDNVGKVANSFLSIDYEILKKYLEECSIKNRGVFAKITVEDGKVYDPKSLARGVKTPLESFGVGTSNRALKVPHRAPKNNDFVLLIPSARFAREDYFELQNGSYAILRDAKSIYKVEFDEFGQISTVLEKFEQE